ncbi:MAG TPA: pentapeptide repeat-containing protein, partial [Verrucomicrobiae bacterium]|nr:pentapeptide repeat-containing protein [Verrucomicrobiae bacterium]
MADPAHVRIVLEGATAIAKWRKENPFVNLDLSGSNFQGKDISGADLSFANLKAADFSEAELRHADLNQADLTGANFRKTNLMQASIGSASLVGTCFQGACFYGAGLYNSRAMGADFRSANLANSELGLTSLDDANLTKASLFRARLDGTKLDGADLSEVNLTGATLRGLDLSKVRLKGAQFGGTVFVDIDLSVINDIESLVHCSASIVSIDSHYRSRKRLPADFLQQLGVSAAMIANLGALLRRPIEFLRCAIYYAPADLSFAATLCHELRQAGIRCWPRTVNSHVSCLDYEAIIVIWSAATIGHSWFIDRMESLIETSNLNLVALISIQLDDAILNWEHPLREKIVAK